MSGPCDVAPMPRRNILVPGASPGQVIVVGPDGGLTAVDFVPLRAPMLLATVSSTPSPLTATQQYSPSPPNADLVVFDGPIFDTFGGYDSGTGLYTVPSSFPYTGSIYLLQVQLVLNGFFVDDDSGLSYGEIRVDYGVDGPPIGISPCIKPYLMAANAGDGYLMGTLTFVYLAQLAAGSTVGIYVSHPGAQTGFGGSLEVGLNSNFMISYAGQNLA